MPRPATPAKQRHLPCCACPAPRRAAPALHAQRPLTSFTRNGRRSATYACALRSGKPSLCQLSSTSHSGHASTGSSRMTLSPNVMISNSPHSVSRSVISRIGLDVACGVGGGGGWARRRGARRRAGAAADGRKRWPSRRPPHLLFHRAHADLDRRRRRAVAVGGLRRSGAAAAAAAARSVPRALGTARARRRPLRVRAFPPARGLCGCVQAMRRHARARSRWRSASCRRGGGARPWRAASAARQVCRLAAARRPCPRASGPPSPRPEVACGALPPHTAPRAGLGPRASGGRDGSRSRAARARWGIFTGVAAARMMRRPWPRCGQRARGRRRQRHRACAPCRMPSGDALPPAPARAAAGPVPCVRDAAASARAGSGAVRGCGVIGTGQAPGTRAQSARNRRGGKPPSRARARAGGRRARKRVKPRRRTGIGTTPRRAPR
jgi:hypothetical protein